MNVIKKYWESVYIYVLLLIPVFCISAGIFWTICKAFGLYTKLQWIQIAMFDGSQLVYLAVALYIIHQNRKDGSFIANHLPWVKGFIIFLLFIQYNFILYLFPSSHVWACTFLFFAAIVFLFDSKLMFINLLLYAVSLLVAHITKPELFLPLDQDNLGEVIAFRIVIFTLTATCIMFIVYFAERFLIHAREDNEENVHLMEKQLEYYKDMELLDTELRKFRHDIKNHFICMESLLENGKVDELESYFQELQQSFSFSEKLQISGNDIVDAILHHDLPHHCKEEVEVTVYGSLPEIMTVSPMDLCTLFSNLLSNAITSANQCADMQESQINIHFSSGKTYFSIAISNSVASGTMVEKRHTDRNHGYGIRKIRGVLEKYEGKLEQCMEDGMINITVYLPI